MKSKLLAAFFLLYIFAPPSTAQQADLDIENQLSKETQNLSRLLKIHPSDLVILSYRTIELPNINKKIRLLKILDTKTGECQKVALDSGHKIYNYEELMEMKKTLHFEKYGSMQRALFNLVSQKENRIIPVMIKLNVSRKFIDKTELPGGKELVAIKEKAAQIKKETEQKTMEMFRTTLLDHKISHPKRVSVSNSFIGTALDSESISRISKDPRVLFIGLNEEVEIPDSPTIEESLPTTMTNRVHDLGIKGKGVKIAILESGTITEPAGCFNIGAVQDNTVAADDHLTKSVAIIGNRYKDGSCSGNWTGYAPEATVLIANDVHYSDRYDWAVDEQVNIVSMSWHFPSEETDFTLHSRDQYFDDCVVHYPWPTVFSSAGNQAASGAYASGKGFNFFGVGNIINDGDGNRYNDEISTSSSWKNPCSTICGREIPEIASPGSQHELLDSSFGGTSCATPVTAAITALLMSANSSLKVWPEANRAILLASANYQMADDAVWSYFEDGKDGAGMTNASLAYYTAMRRETGDTAQNRAHDYGIANKSSFNGGYFKKTWKAYSFVRFLFLVPKIRIAFTWNSKTTETDSTLDADLDLHVYDPDMNLVAYSGSWDNNIEFVEFKAKKTGAYTIKIYGYNVPENFRSYYGIAWTSSYPYLLAIREAIGSIVSIGR